MGQAKQRGSYEQRLLNAQTKLLQTPTVHLPSRRSAAPKLHPALAYFFALCEDMQDAKRRNSNYFHN